LYYVFMSRGSSLVEVRTIVFTTLIMSNILLTFANRSFNDTFLKTIRYKNNLVLPVLIISLGFLVAIHSVSFIRELFGMSVLSVQQIAICLTAALISVGWFELYKMSLRFSIASINTDYKQTF